MNIPWIEKYRPKTLDDVVGNPEIIRRLKEFSKTGNIPNLIISGPPGCGKTTSIWALARDMLGDKVKDACLELNASDERGIDVVRERIKRFASTKVTLPDNIQKIVILDEADSMTEGAQQALRRIMEIFSSTTRFAFACNQSDKIIEPLQSRCAIVRFTKLSDEQLLERIHYICKQENVKFVEQGIQAIIHTSQGDMRQALNNLQCTATSYGKITKEFVYKVCDEPNPSSIKEIFQHCVDGETKEAFDIIEDIYNSGYSIEDLVGILFRNVKIADIPEALRIEFIMEIGKCHSIVAQGLSTKLQMAGLIARLSSIQEKLSSN
uniref:Replication factor C subunit 2 n=1 Tax=Meloidogyne incognita TaxID=6306 RepID=A0A914MG60_MELIC